MKRNTGRTSGGEKKESVKHFSIQSYLIYMLKKELYTFLKNNVDDLSQGVILGYF